MKARTSFLKRCLALALALVLMASCANTGALQVFAAGSEVTVQIGKIVADNYDLTSAEKALLSSGQLAANTYSYSEPTEDLVDVNTDKKQITAAAHEDWVATQAKIMVDGAAKETVTLTEGKGNYTYTGNTFSVQVTYVLDIEVDADVQSELLKTPGWLKAGVANVDKVNAESGALSTLELAMPDLVKLADNGYTVFGQPVYVSESVKNAIYNLNKQVKDNGGHLNLVEDLEAYNDSKVEYLLKNGADLKAEIADSRENINWIYKALTDIQNIVNSLGEDKIDGNTVNLIKTLAALLGKWVGAADKALAGDWTAAEKGLALVAENADYAKLDALVAALGETSAPAAKNPLRVAVVDVQKNLNMYNVTVKVILKTVENKADSAELVVYGESTPVVLTLSAGAKESEVLAAVAAANIEADALANWTGVYVAEHFEATATALPEELAADTNYTITYAPKNYALDLEYAEDMTVPYGYQYTLPKHADPAQAYDYTVNGATVPQGSVVVIEGDTVITRAAGKAYTTGDLYELIADNFAKNDVTKNILTSEALKGNEIINVRKPDPADSASLIKLDGGKLVIIDNTYAADYKGLNWVPYTYGANGNENKFGANPTEVDWTGDSVKVKYILKLTNFEGRVQTILSDVVTLKSEADAQVATLNRLNDKYDQMGQLDKTKLGALKGVISVTDLNSDPAKNAGLQALFTEMVDGILAKNMNGNNLAIYAMLSDYQAGGLYYYYNNSAKVIGEIDSLSGYLSGLLKADDKFTAEEKLGALTALVSAAGYPEYVDKISELENILAEVKSDLTAPNALIDLKAATLKNLTDALTSAEEIDFVASGAPYMVSENLTAIDNSKVMIQVFVEINGKSETFTSAPQKKGYTVTQADVDALKGAVQAYHYEQVSGAAAMCYDVNGLDELLALVGTELTKNVNIYITITPTEYTVSIDGEADQIITVKNPNFKLPAHPKAGWIYTYNIQGAEVVVGNTEQVYTVTAETLAALDDAKLVITRTETNKAQEDLEGELESNKIVKPVYDDKNNLVGIKAEMDPGAEAMETFATELTALAPYIELNDRVLLDTGIVTVQTLVDAILEDNTFGSQTLIDLGKNNGGKVFTGIMDLGNSKDAMIQEGVEFTFTLKSVPSQMKTVSNGLEKVKNYMSFKSQDGVMALKLTLPEKAYEAYLTAMLGAGVVDKYDVNAINAEIAYQYLYDYVDIIMETEADTTTYTNTLKKLGQSYDLTGAEKYYQAVKSVLTHKNTTVSFNTNTTAGDGEYDVKVSAMGKPAVDKLLALLGIDLGDKASLLGIINEYQEGKSLSVAAVAELGNTPTKYEALILDLNASGALKKFDYTADLPARVKTAKNNCAVILLGDVDGNLNFPGNTILDLNGFTVTGNVSAKGELIIVDSCLETASEGGINGDVKATAITGGTYTKNVTPYLKSGYKAVKVGDKYLVQNALFTVEKKSAKSGDIYTYVANTEFMFDESIGSYRTFAVALAADVAVDLALNYYTAASLSVDGNGLYSIDFDQLIGLITADKSKVEKVDDLIVKTLACFDVPGIGDVAETIANDLLDFAAINEGLVNNTAVVDYEIKTAPWYIEVEHVTDGDYIDFGITANEKLSKKFTVGIAFGGDNKYLDLAKKLTAELAEIVVADETGVTIDLEQPVYTHKHISAAGAFGAKAAIDVSGNSDYVTILSVILAYGNPEKSAKVAAAINSGKTDDLKEVIDNTTVAQIFTALKKMSRNVDFKAMATEVGVNVNVDSAANLEHYMHLMLCASGKALEKLEITGMNSKLGNLYNEQTGWYELSKKDIYRDGEISKRGFGAYAEVTLTEVTLKVKLFGDDCLWGDADHIDGVDLKDPTLILQHVIGLNPDPFCTLRTDVDRMDGIDLKDATYVLQYIIGLIPELPVQ